MATEKATVNSSLVSLTKKKAQVQVPVANGNKPMLSRSNPLRFPKSSICDFSVNAARIAMNRIQIWRIMDTIRGPTMDQTLTS